ncbi:MAG: hypothetical protein LBT30_07205 [Clostridiales bacterium]|jgi:polygalacturonase|nr:hypothetical protein [Clostridiales bacterium]
MKKKKKIIIVCLISFFAVLSGVGFGVLYVNGYNGLGAVYAIQPGDFYDKVPYDDYIGTAADVIPDNLRIYDITNYGAAIAADAAQNAKAINAAIESCSDNGGGIVLVNGGAYSSGTVYLKSNVTLFVKTGSALVASHSFADFKNAFIKAENADNAVITGGGKISGEGEYFLKAPKETHRFEPIAVSDIRTLNSEYRARLRFGKWGRLSNMVLFDNCQNVYVHDIIIENSMAWTLTARQCGGVLFENLVINNNRHAANTDGIDIVGSDGVVVRHTFISTADDGIVLKNPKADDMREMKNIRIYDCKIMTCTNAFKIGSETYGDISDVIVEDIEAFTDGIFPGSVAGISIESMDGARVTDITIRNFSMSGVTCPLFIRLGNRNRYGKKSYKGEISGITIENVTAREAELPSIISGVAKNKNTALYVKNVTLTNFDIEYRESPENVILRSKIPEYKKAYPENWRFGDVPAYGLWARHAEDLTLNSFNVTPRSANTRKCTVFDDVI